MRMIGHAELPADYGSDSIQRPPIGLESRFERPSLEDLQESLPLLVTQARRAPGPGMTSQDLQPFGTVFKPLGPGADGSATDSQAPGDFGLGELAFEQEPTAFQAPFFELCLREDAGLPHTRPA